MSEKKVHISYDKSSGELIINWDHDTPSVYDPVEQDEGPAWISLKRCLVTGRTTGVMVENFESLISQSNISLLGGIRDFDFETVAEFDEDD